MSDYERVFVRFRGRTIGPFTPDKVKEMVRRGQVTRMHELSGDGLSWMKADEFGNFFPHAPSMGSSELAAGASSVPPGGGGGMDEYDEGGGAAAAPMANENATAQWYAHVNGEKQGPVSMDQMRLYTEAKLLKKDSLVWKNGMDEWKPASQAIPELFGGAAATASATASSGEPAESMGEGVGGPLLDEMSQNHSVVLTAAIGLLAAGIVVMLAEIFVLNRPGIRRSQDYMASGIQIALAVAMLVSGGFGIVVASKLKELAGSSSAITALLSVRATNQFWLVGMICILAWLAIVLIIAIAAMATNVRLVDIFV